MKTLYKWSVADYHQTIESGVLDGKSVELLEGEIITVSHQDAKYKRYKKLVLEMTNINHVENT